MMLYSNIALGLYVEIFKACLCIDIISFIYRLVLATESKPILCQAVKMFDISTRDSGDFLALGGSFEVPIG